VLTGTAGVSPASSNRSLAYQLDKTVAFHEGGRDARGPSEELD